MATAMVLDPQEPPMTRPDFSPSQDPSAAATVENEQDLYISLKTLNRELEFVEIQEDYVKDEVKNLRREHLRAQEEVKRIQSDQKRIQSDQIVDVLHEAPL